MARGLDADDIPCPSAHDPGRNPHRTQAGWHPATVRAIRALGDIPALLADADPADKAELYRLLAVGLVWDPTTHTATTEAGVGAIARPAAPDSTGRAGHVGITSVRGGT